MTDEIIARLEYFEETIAGEVEIWLDPVTGDYYHDYDTIKKSCVTLTTSKNSNE